MKGGMIYFTVATVFVLAVVGVAMVVSGGFDMLRDTFGPAGIPVFIAVFVLLAVGFVAMVRRSLQRAMQQGGMEDPAGREDEPPFEP